MVDIIFKPVLSLYQVGYLNLSTSELYSMNLYNNSGFWRLTDKIGRPLEEIHLSGDVPQCKIIFQRFLRMQNNNVYFVYYPDSQGEAAE